MLWPVPIGGLSYTAGEQTGVTSASGEFQYENGDFVEFRLGGTVLGSSRVASELSLFDLRSGFQLRDARKIVAALDDPDSPFTAAANVIRLLYSLDDDENLVNGITVDVTVSDLLESRSLNFQRDARDFAYSEEVQAFLGEASRTLVPLEVGLADQYRAADVLLSDDRVTVGRKLRIEQQARTEGDGLSLASTTEYDYDAPGKPDHRRTV